MLRLSIKFLVLDILKLRENLSELCVGSFLVNVYFGFMVCQDYIANNKQCAIRQEIPMKKYSISTLPKFLSFMVVINTVFLKIKIHYC